jgi:hypothetical protein
VVTNCPQCGARVDAPPGPTPYVHTCHYCNAQIPIEPLAAPAPPPPAEQLRIQVFGPGAGEFSSGLRSPEERMAVARAQIAAATAGAKATGKFVLWVIVLSCALPVLIPLFIFLGPTLRGLYASHFSSFPVAVGMNETLELNKCQGTLNDTMVTVGINGKLTLRNCHLKGAMIVKAGVNAQITIVDSTLDGKKGIIDTDGPNVVVTIENSTITSAEELVEDGAENIKVSISKGSKIVAGAVAIPADNNAEVTIEGSTLEGKLGGIDIKNNGKVKLTGSSVVKSDIVGVHLVNNGHLTVTSSRIEGKDTAVRAEHNAEGTLRNATLTGGKTAIDVGSNAHVTSYQTTFTGAKLVPKYSTLDEH